MTLRTGLRIAQSLMIGIGGIDEVCSMAVDTIHRKCGELVVHMAVLAQHRLVCPRQREFRVVMGERCRAPARRGMTCHAIRLKLRRCVIWRGRCTE